MKVILLTEEKAAEYISINLERFKDLARCKRLKTYKRGDVGCYKQEDLDKLTWDDIMGPIDPDGDEGEMFDLEVRTL